MKMSVIVTFDNSETAAVASKAAQKVAHGSIVCKDSFNIIQNDNVITVELDETDRNDPRIIRMAVMNLKSIIDILYTLA